MIKEFIKENGLIVVLSIMCIVTLSIAGTKFINDKKLVSGLDDMYYIETLESKEKYFLLEIETNPLFTFDMNDENVSSAFLHFKNGDVYNVLVNSSNNTFYLDDVPNKILSEKTYKYNKTLYQIKKQEEKNESNDVIKLDLDK